MTQVILEMRLSPLTVAIVVRLFAIFNNEGEVYAWLRTRNLGLGGASPLMLINRGMAEKVFTFIKDVQSIEGLK